MLNSKRKGDAGEHAFAKWMVDNGLKCQRNPMSGGSIWKGDIANELNLAIEVKTVKKINLQEAWRQVARDSGLSHADPVLAIRFDNFPKDKWLMVLDSDYFLDLLTKTDGVRTDYKDPKLKWALTTLKTAITGVMKYLP